jgi:hypothetical protein
LVSLLRQRLEEGERIDHRRRVLIEMSSPAILTLSASGLRRAPWQVSHGCAVWYLDSSSRIHALSVLQHAAVEVADHALERLVDAIALAPVLEGERHGLPPVPCRMMRRTSPGRSCHGVSSEKP